MSGWNASQYLWMEWSGFGEESDADRSVGSCRSEELREDRGAKYLLRFAFNFTCLRLEILVPRI